MYSYGFFKTINQNIILPLGIKGKLKVLNAGELSVFIEPNLTLNELQENDDNLLNAIVNHDRILRELCEQVTLLPLRFGTCFISEEDLLRYLKENCQEYLEKLGQLENKGEYTLRLISVELKLENITNKNLKGREYFLAKKQIYQQQLDYKNIQNQELELILSILQKEKITYLFPDSQTEKIYLLLSSLELKTITDLLTSLKLTTWQIELGEKLPPYHFV